MSTRQPDRLDAWILGTGIASLTAAVYLVQEAHVPPERVHILETLGVAGGTTMSFGDAETGYDYRAGIRLPFNDVCMDEMLSLVPSPTHPGQTVRDDILRFAESTKKNTKHPVKTRFLGRKSYGVSKVESKRGASLGLRDRLEMLLLMSKSEKTLGRSKIQEYFHESFFRSGYWLTLATTFGFKPSHSAVEFRRYLQRFSDLHDLQHPHLVESGEYNFHESIIAPVANFLTSKGVDFRYHTTVTDILFATDPNNNNQPTKVTAIQTEHAQRQPQPQQEQEQEQEEDEPPRLREEQLSASPPSLPSLSYRDTTETIHLQPDDIVIVTLGSTSSSLLPGTNARPPPCLERIQSILTLDPNSDATIDSELDENWLLWLELATKHRIFGNAYNFCTRLFESRIESITLTLSTPEFFDRLATLTGNTPGPGTLITLKDHPWLLSLRIPLQPVFRNQPAHVHVCWGYALFPEREGTFVQKPMLACSGREILTEILHYLNFPVEEILSKAITVPCVMPRAAATLLPRNPDDRPQVIPPGVENLALIGPFVDIPDEVVVTVDYSVRGAQTAVRRLMGIDRPVKKSKRTSATNVFHLF